MKVSKAKLSRPKRQTAQEFAELQRLMAGAVMHPLSKEGGSQARWRGRSMRKTAGEFIKSNDRLTSFERLEIYNRQYWYRIKDCFYDDYPGLRALLGDEAFEKLALAYLNRWPSHSFTLRNLGQKLVAFLEKEPRWLGAHRKTGLELARLEWAHILAFDNEAAAPLETDSLLGTDPEKLHLRLQPYVSLLHLSCELDEFLIEVKKNEQVREEASNAVTQSRSRKKARLKKRLQPNPIYLAVHRHNEFVHYKRLDPGQYLLLCTFRDGASLAEACEALAQEHATDLGKLQSWFKVWASLGWFCKLE